MIVYVEVTVQAISKRIVMIRIFAEPTQTRISEIAYMTAIAPA